MGFFIFIAFLVGFFMICYTGTNVGESYNKDADVARDKYMTEHAEEFRKFNISAQEALSNIKFDKKHDMTVLGYFFWISLILGIVAIVLVCIVGDKFSDKGSEVQSTSAILGSMIALTWGYLSSLLATSLVTGGIKERIYERLEKYRCPHCNAPLSYFETDTYDDGNVYFQKKVSKYDYDLHMTVYETENWMRYNEHHIYTCSYCRKKDDIIKEKEEKLDKPSLMAAFRGAKG